MPYSTTRISLPNESAAQWPEPSSSQPVCETDPQLSVNLDHPTNDVTGAMNGWGLRLSYDILPLITRQARIDAETNADSQLDLDLLWQEWQVAQQARSLYIRYQSESLRLAMLEKTRALYRNRYDHSARALAQGNLTLDISGTDLTALVDISSQINLEQSQWENRIALETLLSQHDGGLSDTPVLPEK